jgi:hypothetical protein
VLGFHFLGQSLGLWVCAYAGRDEDLQYFTFIRICCIYRGRAGVRIEKNSFPQPAPLVTGIFVEDLNSTISIQYS